MAGPGGVARGRIQNLTLREELKIAPNKAGLPEIGNADFIFSPEIFFKYNISLQNIENQSKIRSFRDLGIVVSRAYFRKYPRRKLLTDIIR